MHLYWLQQDASEVPLDDGWLSATERERLGALRLPKRRADFRLGRFTAKRALAAYLGAARAPALPEIEVRAAPSGAPVAYARGEPVPVSLSLSHRNGQGLCAVAEPALAIGCDLELVEDHGPGFVSDFFTTEEQAFLAQAPLADRLALCTVLWSAKESALKALKTGLRLDTREVVVTLPLEAQPVGDWRPLAVRQVFTGVCFTGFFRVEAARVLVLVSAPSSRGPLPLADRA